MSMERGLKCVKISVTKMSGGVGGRLRTLTKSKFDD